VRHGRSCAGVSELRLIPVVGTLIWAGASVFGIGVALATKFGRREPWFLWTPAPARAR
jgi:hypothetical protein